MKGFNLLINSGKLDWSQFASKIVDTEFTTISMDMYKPNYGDNAIEEIDPQRTS